MKPRRNSNAGSALPAVLLVMAIVMTLVTAVVSLSSTQTKEEIFFEDDTSAFHAAEAGANKYLWFLNKEGSTIDMDTVITYPEGNPTAAYQLKSITDNANTKTIRSTGWKLSDPDVKQTVEVTFQKRSFTQYIYFSDEDPDSIFWSSDDNCYGPYHTNTSLSSSGHPNFWGKVTTVQGIKYQTNSSTDSPVFHAGYEKLTSKIEMPANNSELMGYGLDSQGYYYAGRTSIMLNSDGTITVWNPNNTPAIQTRPLPVNGVIYVNEKSGSNYDDKFNPNNGNVFISGVLDGRLTVAAKHDIYVTGYNPTVLNKNSAGITNGITYKDTQINLNDSVITVNETAGQAESDMLGLVADANVAVLTQGWFNDKNVDSSRPNMNIYAAIMAINNSFINSMFIPGNPPSAYPTPGGTLTVRGAIIQNKRGAVGYVGGTGYKKNYAHDIRMMYDSPPHFLKPDGSGWEITEWND